MARAYSSGGRDCLDRRQLLIKIDDTFPIGREPFAWVSIQLDGWGHYPMNTTLKRLGLRVFAAIFPKAYKRREELAFWKGRHSAQGGILTNNHYEPLYTSVFGITRDDYNGNCVLDIGCGPRGSLEWADMTAKRVGLDPLVPSYLKLGADKHKMEYVASGSEKIPFIDGYFDIVASLNSLDHVDNIDATIREIKRVTKVGGLFLLSVETDHPPSATEPVTIDDAKLDTLGPEFELLSAFRVGTPSDHDVHRAVLTRNPPYLIGKPGIYVASYRRL